MPGRSSSAALVAAAILLVLAINRWFELEKRPLSLPAQAPAVRGAPPTSATEFSAAGSAATPLPATKAAAPPSEAIAASPLKSVVCGDNVCSPSETRASCYADCPGITTPPKCGEEPHADPGGVAVAWGITHRTESAAECCDRCAAHADAHTHKPCNSWVFCHEPQCWSLDSGHNHTFGECWLKWQANPAAVLYGQRGKYTEEFRQKHRNVHRGVPVPTHVPWTGGVMGQRVDLSVRWETGLEGMRSSTGEELTNWRAWEAPGVYEKRLAARRAGRRRDTHISKASPRRPRHSEN